MGSRAAARVGVWCALAASLALGTSNGLPAAGLREVVPGVPVVGPGGFGSVGLRLALWRRRGWPLDGGGAEAQDGAQAAPILLALSLHAVGDRLLHLLPTGQQLVHQVHVGSRWRAKRGRVAPVPPGPHRAVTIAEKTGVVNPGLGWGSMWWKSFLELPLAFTHSLRSAGLNHHLLGAHYTPGPTPGFGEC